MKVNEQIKANRIKAGMTQKELADGIKTYQANIANIEEGKLGMQINTLQKIVDFTGYPVVINLSKP